ncbi:SDR family oxidoreductase [Thalassospiraceae bacterium LMO-JJ14]|nr:SDR family oxidoreductase [Thalassospiraceae bacterium LMO-JJ14]
MTPIVVTGGFGYVGGRIVQTLLEDGADVRVVTRRAEHEIPAWALSHVTWGDDLKRLCDGAGCLIHLAAPNEIASAADPEKEIAATLALTEAALAAAHAAGIGRFIYFSTVHVYGPLNGHIDENTPTAPTHPYAVAHLESEKRVEAASGNGLAALTLRLSNGFGAPADTGTDRWTLLVNDLCRQAVQERKLTLTSDGRQRRDFLPLTDIAAATRHFAAMNPFPAPYQVINLSAGRAMSVLEMAYLIQDRAGKLLGADIALSVADEAADRQDGGPTPELEIDNSRLCDTGFSPKAPLDAEIDALLQFCINEATPTG